MELDPNYFPKNQFALMDKKRWVSAAAAVVAGVAVLVVYFQSGPKASSFAQAEVIFAKWTASSSQDLSSYSEMSDALKRVPALQEKYEPFIAQKLIEGGKGADALQIAYRSLMAARQETPYHSLFAETSLLIERGEFQTALERSAALKERMIRECEVDRFSGER